ncbi:hypothetical protein DFJ73DRAFT_491167 [Zopfochytrium polystomum]|nr:hypothetical protein DFJ73DRAFT_491167 [Zopfochytrium polystomum]
MESTETSTKAPSAAARTSMTRVKATSTSAYPPTAADPDTASAPLPTVTLPPLNTKSLIPFASAKAAGATPAATGTSSSAVPPSSSATPDNGGSLTRSTSEVVIVISGSSHDAARSTAVVEAIDPLDHMQSAAAAISPSQSPVSPKLAGVSPFVVATSEDSYVADVLAADVRVAPPSHPLANERRNRRARRIAVVRLRYDCGTAFFDQIMPSELEGMLSNLEYAIRMQTLNTALSHHWTLLDIGPPMRAVAAVLSVAGAGAFVVFVFMNASVAAPFAALVLGGVLSMFLVAGLHTYKPTRTVRQVLADWNAEDEPRHGIHWRSIRQDKAIKILSFLPVAVPWSLVVERATIQRSRNSTGPNADDAEENDDDIFNAPLVDALPLYVPPASTTNAVSTPSRELLSGGPAAQTPRSSHSEFWSESSLSPARLDTTTLFVRSGGRDTPATPHSAAGTALSFGASSIGASPSIRSSWPAGHGSASPVLLPTAIVTEDGIDLSALPPPPSYNA